MYDYYLEYGLYDDICYELAIDHMLHLHAMSSFHLNNSQLQKILSMFHAIFLELLFYH